MQRSLHSGRMKLRRCFASLLHVYNYVKKEGMDKEINSSSGIIIMGYKSGFLGNI